DNGVGCTKPSYGRGAGTVPAVCDAGRVNSAGLCYRNCPAAYGTGIGPVCWKACALNAPFNCGGGCAKNAPECIANMPEQAIGAAEFVTKLAVTLETGGFGLEVEELATGGKELYMAMVESALKGVMLSDTTELNVANTVNQAFPNANSSQKAF